MTTTHAYYDLGDGSQLWVLDDSVAYTTRKTFGRAKSGNVDWADILGCSISRAFGGGVLTISLRRGKVSLTFDRAHAAQADTAATTISHRRLAKAGDDRRRPTSCWAGASGQSAQQKARHTQRMTHADLLSTGP